MSGALRTLCQRAGAAAGPWEPSLSRSLALWAQQEQQQRALALTLGQSRPLPGPGAGLVAAWRAAQHSAAGVHTSAARAATEVKVQSMGESISEGTVAALLKKQGERVDADEPILQIETDKVTIDVRAPEGGVLTHLLVGAEDTVTPGQLVAVVDPAAEPTAAGAATPAPQPPSPPEPAPALAHAEQKQAPQPSGASGQEHAAGRRVPGIHFPKRYTAEGLRISSLPAAEQPQHLEVRGAGPAVPAEPETGAEAWPPRESPRGSVAVDGGVTTSLRRALASALGGGAHPRWYAGKERGTKLGSSQVLTEQEMETIELGGAPP